LKLDDSLNTKQNFTETKLNQARILRVFDVVLAVFGIVASLPIMIIAMVTISINCGAPLFIQRRIGCHEKEFSLFKIRTMQIGVEQAGTHTVSPAYLLSGGSFLRKTKIDELPQLWNVLLGDMSMVGPRPCLPNQHDVIAERKKLGIFEVLPGITGYSQTKGIDMSEPGLLANCDAKMIQNLNVSLYLKIIIITLVGEGFGDKVDLS
jgi:lipopolysaccharide/colanic/teichoic acid biosynthesis glycosyltransferase